MRYYNCSGDIWKISLVCITSRVWSKITKKKNSYCGLSKSDRSRHDSFAINRSWTIDVWFLHTFCSPTPWIGNIASLNVFTGEETGKKGSLLEFKREWIWTLIINLSLGKYLFSICSKCQKVMTCKWNLKVKISLKLIIFFWQIAGIIFICILNLKIYILKIVHN